MNTIQLYDLFRKELNLPDEKAAAFVSAIEEVKEIDTKRDFQTFSNEEGIPHIKDNIKEIRENI